MLNFNVHTCDFREKIYVDDKEAKPGTELDHVIYKPSSRYKIWKELRWRSIEGLCLLDFLSVVD